MSLRVLNVSRLANVSNFNFFFQNTKKNLVIDQNFFSNQVLTFNYRGLIHGPRLSSKNTTSALHNDEKDSILRDVASKVLTCQEPEAKAIQTAHLPFKVTPKQTRAAKTATIPTELTIANLRALAKPYIKLTKPNLTVLVTLSSICSYALSPTAVSLSHLLFLSVGTALCSGAANAINMGREPELDRLMQRTANRPVVRGVVTPNQAFTFAGVTGALGCTVLSLGVNPTVAALGLLNIVLYSWIYTSLKRKSILNTWIGAVVGAIPPLMGWAASSSLTHPGGWCLAGLLYAWQFPHFNALSHNVAQQYKNAGYIMTAAENPKLNARVSLRYSLLMFPLCFGLSYFGVTDWYFQLDSAIFNGWLTVLAYQFWKQQNKNHSSSKGPTAEGITAASIQARKLFWCSVWQLPAVLILAMLHKKGQWDRLTSFLGFNNGSNSNYSTPLS